MNEKDFEIIILSNPETQINKNKKRSIDTDFSESSDSNQKKKKTKSTHSSEQEEKNEDLVELSD